MRTVRRGTLLIVALSAGWLSLSALDSEPQRQAGLPGLMLWAWERPTDLRSVDAGTGVAFLSQTLIVRNDAVEVRPRRNPLRVLPHTPLVAVTRIESGGHAPRPRTGQPGAASLITTMANAIAGAMALPRVRGVQIDFDAAESERPFYRMLVQAVRAQLGAGVPLSITALASWCAQDRWMEGLPVDEAVPMLFRMGPVNAPYAGLARSPSSAAAGCRGALGTSLDEPLHVRAAGRRVYVFNPAPWTPETVAQAHEVIE
jgi:hypothetical protein